MSKQILRHGRHTSHALQALAVLFLLVLMRDVVLVVLFWGYVLAMPLRQLLKPQSAQEQLPTADALRREVSSAMFTGLVEALGTVRAVQADGPGRILQIAEPTIAVDLSLGASVAVNGVCLTVTDHAGEEFAFAAGPETLRLTNLGELEVGARVNLERSLRLGDRLGGHIVQGHVDGVGHIARREIDGEWETVWFSCPPLLTREMVRKGSIAIDGVSLTLVEVGPDLFSVALIPHTLHQTTLGFKKPGDSVNLETDIFGKYVAKLTLGYLARLG